MKNCPECGKPVSLHLMFCGVCGAKVDQPLKIRRARILFFLLPYLLLMIGLALSFDLGINSPADSGIAFGGSFALIYLFAAAFFWILCRMFKLPVLPESYWQAGLFSVGHFVACSALAYCLDLMVIGDAPLDLGPTQVITARLEILAMIFLPSWFAGILAVSARAKTVRFPDEIKKPLFKFFARNGVTILPVFFLAIAALLFYLQPPGIRAFISARVYSELDASQKAINLLDDALSHDDAQAGLHFMKGAILLDSQLENYTPADAVKHLEKAVALKPGVPVYMFRLSMAYDLNKIPAQAISTASSAASLLGKDAFLWQNVGHLQFKYRKLPEAVQSFRKALELNPHNPVVLNDLAFSLLELDQDLPQALEMAKRSVEFLPNLDLTLDTLAWAYYKNAMPAEALEVMSAMYEGRAEISPEVDFHYAVILNELGLLKEPLRAFEDLLARPEVAADHNLFKKVFAAREALIAKADTITNSGKDAEVTVSGSQQKGDTADEK